MVYPQFSVPFEALQVQLAPTLSVYVPGRDKPMRVLTVRDSVYWDIDPSVSDKAVIKEISERASSLLVPHLTLTGRILPAFISVEARRKCAMR